MAQFDSMHSFEALADPTRRKIIAMLARRELAASAIARKFDMTPSAISQHLNVLKEAKLVRMRVDAQKRIYSVNPKSVEKAEKWLRNISRFWNRRLDLLERALKRPKSKRKRPASRKKRRLRHGKGKQVSR
jgi:DNA-binding transcriptional ArsR family regulator